MFFPDVLSYGVDTPQKLIGEWAQDRFKRTYVGLECDFLRGQKFGQAISMPNAAASSASSDAFVPQGTTSNRVLNLVDRSIRDACANAVSVSVMMLSNDENKRLCMVALSVCGPVKAWEGHASKVNRSNKESTEWGG